MTTLLQAFIFILLFKLDNKHLRQVLLCHSKNEETEMSGVGTG